ncbi:hypothetical protein TDCHD05_60033 [Tenacibaculum dicentrarchi]|nr:hypothetical protein TDCHD05_60033 [Tenacibaculum dicentrarchi]
MEKLINNNNLVSLNLHEQLNTYGGGAGDAAAAFGWFLGTVIRYTTPVGPLYHAYRNW